MIKRLYKGRRLSDNEWVYGELMQTVYTEKDLSGSDNKKIGSFIVTTFYIDGKSGSGVGTKEQVDPETICQSLGVADKYGHDLYEGDKVEFINKDFDGHKVKLRGVIKYESTIHNCGFVIKETYREVIQGDFKPEDAFGFYYPDGQLFYWNDLTIIGTEK